MFSLHILLCRLALRGYLRVLFLECELIRSFANSESNRVLSRYTRIAASTRISDDSGRTPTNSTRCQVFARRVESRRSTPTARAPKRVVEPNIIKLEAAHAAKQAGRGAEETIEPLDLVMLTDAAPDRNEEPEGVIVVGSASTRWPLDIC